RGRSAPRQEDLLEASTVVEAQELCLTLLGAEVHAVAGQDLAEEFKVDVFVVQQDAVEVEDHRPNHAATQPFSSRKGSGRRTTARPVKSPQDRARLSGSECSPPTGG